MRVLHITHHVPPELDGGVQRVALGLIRHQRRLGVGAAVVTGAVEGRGRPVIWRGPVDSIPVTRIHQTPTERFSSEMGCERIADAVVAAARDFRADLCHLHHWFHLSFDLVRRL